MEDPLDLLAIMAHPDDAELLCGGALIRSADRGERTGVVDLTRGEAGSKGTSRSRQDEAEEAAAVLGLAVRRNAGLKDSGIRNDEDSRARVVALIRAFRPRVVVTHWKEGRHPDHREAARLVYDACFLAGLAKYQAAGAPHRPHKVVHALAYREDAPKPTFVVDITPQMDRKLQAIACYPTQFQGVSGMGEVFPGGERPLEEQIRAACARWGSLIRVAYGEPFWTRETMRLESLGEGGVSTF
jgi:N-acetylglucosamine malate deacetylase 1